MAKRGRPRHATSWWQNSNNVAAHHASVLMETWLAGAPVFRAMLSSLAGSQKHQALIDECWRGRGNERRRTVPPRVKRKLCQLGIAHVVSLHEQSQAATSQIKESLQRGKIAAEAELRQQGWTDEQIAAWFETREPARGRKDFKIPDLKKVLEIVSRRAPATTLRWKATSRKFTRKNSS